MHLSFFIYKKFCCFFITEQTASEVLQVPY
nr:MAG TPA: hypothetical protein [Caudoviricetes sp.]